VDDAPYALVRFFFFFFFFVVVEARISFLFLICSTSGKGMCEGRAYLRLVPQKQMENSVMYVCNNINENLEMSFET
jgi:hypothetical protein